MFPRGTGLPKTVKNSFDSCQLVANMSKCCGIIEADLITVFPNAEQRAFKRRLLASVTNRLVQFHVLSTTQKIAEARLLKHKRLCTCALLQHIHVTLLAR